MLHKHGTAEPRFLPTSLGLWHGHDPGIDLIQDTQSQLELFHSTSVTSRVCAIVCFVEKQRRVIDFRVGGLAAAVFGTKVTLIRDIGKPF